MKRDIMKTISEVKGRIPRVYNLSFNECLELTRQAAGDADMTFCCRTDSARWFGIKY